MNSVVGGALGWLAERLQPSGDAAIRGLEQDLSREATLDGGWWRVCETAWTLGFVELRLVPVPEVADLLAERHDFAPRPWPMLDQNGGGLNAQSTWAFNLTTDRRTIATLTARRRLSRVDFEPMDFAVALQGLIERFVAAPQGSRGEPVAAAGHPDAAANVATPASPLDQ